MTLHVSGSLSAHHQEFLAVHRHWYILCSFDDRLLPGVGWISNANKFGIQCVCWFCSQGICRDARSYDPKIMDPIS
jgi:hypothetical protein